MMSLENITKAVGIDWTRTFIYRDSGSPLNFDFDITPDDFLGFANQDFQSKDKRGIVNAITNAKRSIDCQTDKFLAGIGYEPKADLPQNVRDYIEQHSTSNECVDIRSRLKLLRALDVAPLNLISKIRRIRNLLEHQYKLPTETQVAEAIELATLFRGTVNDVIHNFADRFHIGNEENMFGDGGMGSLLVVDFVDGHFEVIASRQEIKKIQISKTEKQYLELLRLNIAVSIGGNIESALYDLLQTINCNIPQNKVKVKLI